MADWYVSSAAYALVSQWAAGAAHGVGDIVRGLADPGTGKHHCFRCTTAGTSAGTEPTWATTKNGTTNDGTVVWTTVTGESTYNWSAPGGDIPTLFNQTWMAAGDRLFVSSDHSETGASASTFLVAALGTLASPYSVLSVNRLSGHIPPQSADLTTGATIAFASGTVQIDGSGIFNGLTFKPAGQFNFNASSASRPQTLKNCLIDMSGTTSNVTCNQPGVVRLDNTSVKFNVATQTISGGGSQFTLEWLNTASPVQGTIPTALFTASGTGGFHLTCRGVDFSAIGVGTGLFSAGTEPLKASLVNCKLGVGSATAPTPSTTGAGQFIELINCDQNNTNYNNQRWTNPGVVSTDSSTTLASGATDGVTAYSHKLVSNSNASYVNPLESFFLDTYVSTTGSAKTATVEIISSGTLTNGDIGLTLEYLGSSTATLSTVSEDFLSMPGDTTTNVPASSATWNSPPGTPVTQHLQVTFTPQKAGWVRGMVVLMKPSGTVWVNPQMSIA